MKTRFKSKPTIHGLPIRVVAGIVAALVWHLLIPCSGHAAKLTALEPQPGHRARCVAIVTALERYHYLGKKLGNPLSSKIFDRYIKNLDPSSRLFTRSDMNILERYRYSFDNDLKTGNLDGAFQIFKNYHQRAVMRLEFILSKIPAWETDLDLHSRETLDIRAENRPWQADLNKLMVLWEKELSNHIITMQLDQKDPAEIGDTLEKIYKNRLTRLGQTNANDVFQIFMNTVTESFDPHTQYFPPRASEDFDIHMKLSLEGIGAVLQTEYEYTKVVRLIPKGPADKSKMLMPGDKIIGVGQGKTGEIKDTIGQRIDEVVKLIRGPKNTYVRLKIIPAEKSSSATTISIRRDKVKLEEQSAQKQVHTLTYGGREFRIGTIEIPNFYIDFEAYHRGDPNYKSTTTDVKKLLFELKNERIDGLIVDLRDNGGGSLMEANDLTGLFLTHGPTVQIRTKANTSRYYDENPSIEYRGPLLVLINRMSASASEIFAGAIKDYHRGLIVGTRSFGKGTVQELKPLGDGKLKLTSAKFYRVSGESTQHRGVVPDILFPQVYKVEDTGESSLEDALPWDTIPRTRYRAYRSLSALTPHLITRYRERMGKDPGMVYMKKRLELTERLTNETRLSLNIDTREQKRRLEEAEELEIENEYLKATGKAPIASLEENEAKIKNYKEITMKQAQFIMADFITMADQRDYTW